MNPLAFEDARPPALLALEDGTCLRGYACGALGEAFGEVVFNTSMVGYQEIVTDPSYAGQIVTLTYPQVGNYGVSELAMQSAGTALKGLVVRDMCHTPSHWQSYASFPDFLCAHGVVAIEGVDTRALTLRIRNTGAMRAAISTVDLNPESLVARVIASPAISGARTIIIKPNTMMVCTWVISLVERVIREAVEKRLISAIEKPSTAS